MKLGEDELSFYKLLQTNEQISFWLRKRPKYISVIIRYLPILKNTYLQNFNIILPSYSSVVVRVQNFLFIFVRGSLDKRNSCLPLIERLIIP